MSHAILIVSKRIICRLTQWSTRCLHFPRFFQQSCGTLWTHRVLCLRPHNSVPINTATIPIYYPLQLISVGNVWQTDHGYVYHLATQHNGTSIPIVYRRRLLIAVSAVSRPTAVRRPLWLPCVYFVLHKDAQCENVLQQKKKTPNIRFIIGQQVGMLHEYRTFIFNYPCAHVL